MSPELPRINYGEFQTMRGDCAEFYHDAKEQMPHKCHNPMAEVKQQKHLSMHRMLQIKS
jgi:hypothetical protein